MRYAYNYHYLRRLRNAACPILPLEILVEIFLSVPVFYIYKNTHRHASTETHTQANKHVHASVSPSASPVLLAPLGGTTTVHCVAVQ